ncbi:MAG: HTTM domain-containing protein [Flavobacteriaceae bacterium]
MDKLRNITHHLTEKNHFSIYLSLFRVFLAFHIIKKVYLIWGSQSVLLSSNSLFFEHTDTILDFFGIDSSIILERPSIFLITIVALALLTMLGIGRKVTLVLLFISIKILQDLVYPILNGGDNLMILVMLYLLFTNCFEHFTIGGKSRRDTSKISRLVSNLAVYSICFHLGYVYFISAIHKIHADVWFNGTALYYIMHLERFKSPLSELINNNGFITTLATYFTIMFELLFVFLVWNKRYRSLFLISGIFLHLGIYFFMMIYDFEIFFISLYGFFLPNSFWEKILEKIKIRVKGIERAFVNVPWSKIPEN